MALYSIVALGLPQVVETGWGFVGQVRVQK